MKLCLLLIVCILVIKSVPLHPTKSDPVALYHQYQAEWKKQKLPGEDYHKEIRWAIREKMLSGPSIQVSLSNENVLEIN